VLYMPCSCDFFILSYSQGKMVWSVRFGQMKEAG
jgi:hypothetical protein